MLDDDFRSYLAMFYMKATSGAADEKKDWKISGKKRQFLFEFPSLQASRTFRDGMAGLTGIAPDRFTISERHLKVYDEGAEPWPAPHKDRAASEISIGLPVRIPQGSTACVFPTLQFGANQEERAVFLTDRDHPGAEHVYRNEEAVMLHEEFGDVIAFLGSSIFHERVRPAGAAILYIKVNGTGRDPLGENIFAAEVA
ncbi:hypothetical protein GRI75_06935 [Altererythrobacter soli]|uniref:Fe2OG dioxygenase domain-containing protein n=1 Tax=Croceibacterium soli TaxID=1739690 RepID=A0A6I4UWL5_9SPHN|nr:hypothetical protein [Croceibacterium soli]MXP41375.1 hypothetical protein [Croceibacterium soli]